MARKNDVFIGQILTVPFNFPPSGFAFCQGQLLPIAQNQALFSLLGTTYGGNGVTTFALPNLQGKLPIGFGQGRGLSQYDLGTSDGVETVTLLPSELPSHTHSLTSGLGVTIRAKNGPGNSTTPVGNSPAVEASPATGTYSNSSLAPSVNMANGTITLSGAATAASSGGSTAHTNLAPYLTLNYAIALVGIFPSRS